MLLCILNFPGKASANGSVPKAEKAKSIKYEDQVSASGGDSLAKEFLDLSNHVCISSCNTLKLISRYVELSILLTGKSLGYPDSHELMFRSLKL